MSIDKSTKLQALGFHHCDTLQLKGFTSKDSPNKHITIQSCHGVTISKVHIRAPRDSPNTDGIMISGSSQINIYESVIGTGDDCIAIKGGSSNINITHVACGPGHGISIGSLGVWKGTNTVEDVHVRNCNFTRTTNGARIKTFNGGIGYAKAISFEDITLVASKNPIIIDQQYSKFLGNDDPKGESAQKSEASRSPAAEVTTEVTSNSKISS
ncbi:Glycoside hydrolase [Parasponia andersonii]|uniref:Glycoside hydrolase n=1 Tax=Parasponia andersonii TaxID=3476 RepID=A0A2P5ANF1_PARAD|nr:Glycoside hydrolase [Parasponia andersonii]